MSVGARDYGAGAAVDSVLRQAAVWTAMRQPSKPRSGIRFKIMKALTRNTD